MTAHCRSLSLGLTERKNQNRMQGKRRKRIGRKKRPTPTQPFLSSSFVSFFLVPSTHPSIRKGTLTYREHVCQTSKSFPRSSACNERTIERKDGRKNPHLVCLVPSSPIGPIKRPARLPSSCAFSSSSRMENKLIFFASLHGYPFITWSREGGGRERE